MTSPYRSHRLRTTRFGDGDWVASCSCAQYMSRGYSTPDRAMDAATDEHYTEILPPLVDIGPLVRERFQLPAKKGGS